MRYVLFVFVSIFTSLVFAQAFVVDGTNTIQIQFEDITLSNSQKEFIRADIVRTLTPGECFPKLQSAASSSPLIFYLDFMPVPRTPNDVPTLTRKVVNMGTNFVLKVNQNYTDHYLRQEPFFNMHSNAIAKAFEFADLLITNPIMGMTTNQIRGLRLTRAYLSSPIPLKFVEDIRNDLGDGVYFRPSLLGFQMLPYGPSGAAEYLWGYLPNRYSRGVNSVPMIYYNDRWWISYWHLEEDEEEW